MVSRFSFFQVIILLLFLISTKGNAVTDDNIHSIFDIINQIDIEQMDSVFHDNLLFEDKTASFIWDKEKTLSFFQKRKEAGVEKTRRLVLDEIYFVNDNIVDIHGRWVGSVNGKEVEVNFSTVIIFYQNKIIRWTDHYDMSKFK